MPNPEDFDTTVQQTAAQVTAKPGAERHPTEKVPTAKKDVLTSTLSTSTIIDLFDDQEDEDVIVFREITAEKIRARGINLSNIGDSVGRGSKGVAYDYTGNKILKMTTDMSEVASSTAIMGRHIPGVVRVFRVIVFPMNLGKAVTKFRPGVQIDFKLIKPESYVSSPDIKANIVMGWILQEKLKDLPGAIKTEISRMTDHRQFDSPEGGTSLYFAGLVKRYVREKNKEKAIKLKEYAMQQLTEKFNKFEPYEGFWDALDNLKKVGVFWNDCHSQNLMLDRNNKIIIIDLGISQTISSKNPDEIKLEYLLRKIKNVSKNRK